MRVIMNKRKICVVVASRANYGRVKHLMKAIKEHPGLELQLIVGASVMLYRFGNAIDVIRSDGFKPDRTIYYIVEGETLETQAKSTGLGIVELTTAFEDLKPDMVVTVADRFETMATAISASYLNIKLVHIQGGEISGNIDEKVRHSITKLSDIHFPSTKESKQRLIKMGENEKYVFNFGCPGMDILSENDLIISNKIMSKYGGVGSAIDWEKPYVLMVQHPVTTSYGSGYKQVTEVLNALLDLNTYQKIILWPNIDAGTDDISKGLRVFRENNKDLPFHFFRNFSPEDYAKVLNNAKCAIGNSSSFIREGSFLGVPAVIVGDRQEGRECGENVVFSDYNKEDIYKKIQYQLSKDGYSENNLFGEGNSGKLIANKLLDIDLNFEKRMTY
jgi:UDP-hydrolysing UDP-N-acetyl-D-glucosamine 2-epimerase